MRKALIAIALALAANHAASTPLTVGISCDANCPGGSMLASATALGVKYIRQKIALPYVLDNTTTGAYGLSTNTIATGGAGLVWQMTGEATGAAFSARWHVGDTVSSAALPGHPGSALITAVTPGVPSVTLDTAVDQYVKPFIGENTIANTAAAAALGMSTELTFLNISAASNQTFGDIQETDDAFKERVSKTLAAFTATGILVKLISASAEEDAINNNMSTAGYLRMLDLIHDVAAPLGIPVTNGGLTNTGTGLAYWDYLWETCGTTACRRSADRFASGAFIKSEFQSQFAAEQIPDDMRRVGEFLTYGGTLYQQMRKFQALVAAYAARPWMAYTNFHWYQVPANSKIPAIQLIVSQTGHPAYFNQFNNYSGSAVDQQQMMGAMAAIGAVGIEPTTATPGAAHAVSLQNIDGSLLPSGVVFKAFVASPTPMLVANATPEVVVC